MHVKDLEGNEYPLLATTTNDLDLNGNQSLSLKITSNKVNDLFIDAFQEMWTVTDLNNVEHKVIYAKKKGHGERLYIDVKGIPLFFDEFDTDRIYEEYNEHMTASRCFSLIFSDTNFTFALLDAFEAVQWEGFGKGQTKLELFKRALDRYKAEFRISGNTIYLASQIGRDTSIMYRYKLNASNIIQEIDASSFWTYAKGFGDFEEGDEENAKLEREYTSPLAQIPGIGLRHAPPIYDGRVKDAGTMDKSLKELVDDSLKISVSADLHDLNKQGYPIAQAELGDRIFLIDERINLNEEVRVHNISITRDWQGNILDLNIVFGNEGIVKRHQSNLQTAIDRITELVEGRSKLPFNVLDNAVIQATKALQSAQTEISFTDNGLLAVDKTNPNLVVLLNSSGIGISNDGGITFRTAMTGNGIVADLITVGTLRGIYIEGVEIQGSTFLSAEPTEYSKIEGAYIESRGRFDRTWRGITETHDVHLRLENGYLRARNDNKNRSLYYSDFGISTYADGTGDGTTGTIEFFSNDYHETLPGITTRSTYGVVALRSDFHKIILDAATVVEIPRSTLRTNGVGVLDGYNNFYIGVSGQTNGEARVTDKLFFNDNQVRYMPIRASEFRDPNGLKAYMNGAGGAGFDTSPHALTAGGLVSQFTHIYLGTGENSNGEARVTDRRGSNNLVYRPIRARDFITDTSVRENKKDIDIFDENTLDIIRNSSVYKYRRLNDAADSKLQLGLMTDETPDIIHSEAGDSFAMYALVSYLWKAQKDHLKVTDELTNEINWLKMENQMLKQQLESLRQDVDNLMQKEG